MNILVTGALGHIGSKLIRYLPKEFPGCRVTLVDNFSTQRYASLFDLPSGGTYEFHEKDVVTSDLTPLVAESDCVVHLAGMTDAAGSLKQPELIARNFEGTKKVALSCAAVKRPMLFSSSTSVYGTQKEVVDESCSDADLKPQSPYARYKLEEEKFLLEQSRSGGLRAVICRFGTICGVSPGMRFHTAVNKFCFQAVMGQPITVWRTAYDQRRPYLELGDCCRGVAHIIKRDLFNGEIYNLVTENTTVRGIVESIKKRIPGLSVEYVDSQIMNQLSYTISAEKFCRSGFTFSGSLPGAIEETIGILSAANGIAQ